MRIEISQAAERAMMQLPKRLRKKVDKRILELVEDPRPFDSFDVIPHLNIFGVPVDGLHVIYQVIYEDDLLRIIDIIEPG